MDHATELVEVKGAATHPNKVCRHTLFPGMAKGAATRSNKVHHRTQRSGTINGATTCPNKVRSRMQLPWNGPIWLKLVETKSVAVRCVPDGQMGL